MLQIKNCEKTFLFSLGIHIIFNISFLSFLMKFENEFSTITSSSAYAYTNIYTTKILATLILLQSIYQFESRCATQKKN